MTSKNFSTEINDIYEARQNSFRHLALNRINERDLDAFEKFLKAEGNLNRPSLIIRCQITNQKNDMHVVTDKEMSQWRYRDCFLPFFQRVLPHIQGHSDFFILLSDKLYVSESKKAECLEFLKKVPLLRCDQSPEDELSQYCILIPDFYIQKPTYADELVEIEKAVKVNPFEKRSEVIKWRGTIAGPDSPSLENRHQLPRLTLLMMSLEYPELIDARLTNYNNFAENESGMTLKKELEERFGKPANFLSAGAFVYHKYLVSIDGAVSAWKRVPTILASGSVLLLQHRWRQFFYPGLKPWIHYVPLKEDISDLIEKHKWLKMNPRKAQEIAENGRRFAEVVLSPAFLEKYFSEVINLCNKMSVFSGK